MVQSAISKNDMFKFVIIQCFIVGMLWACGHAMRLLGENDKKRNASLPECTEVANAVSGVKYVLG